MVRGPGVLSSPVQVGREDELRALIDVARRPPSLALVEGQAGVGKTRLVSELAGHPGLSGRRVLVGQCRRLREPFPLGPVVAPLGAAVSLPVDAGGERHVLFRAVAETIAGLGPAVLILEDLHWGDEQTVEFLRYLIDDPPSHLALVVTYRREDLQPAALGFGSRPPAGINAARIELAPLGSAEVALLTKAILGVDELAPELVVAVHHRTAGLPFAVEELTRSMADEGVLEQADATAAVWALEALDAPPAVRDSVLERVAALGAEARCVLDTAAVLDMALDEDLLSEVCPLPAADVAAGLDEALRASILVEVEPNRYGFRHPLAAQSVYESIPGPERRRLHQRAAAALEAHRPRPVARIAHHYRAAGEHDRWLRWAEAAADLAIDRGDAAAAVRFLSDALGGTPLSKATRARLATKLGKAALSCGVTRQREAVDVLRAVVSERGPGPERAMARLLLGSLLSWCGEAAASYEHLATSVRELGDPARRTHVMTELAVAPHLGIPVGERVGWLAAAGRLADELNDPIISVEVCAARAALLVHQGEATAWDAVGKLPTEGPSPAVRQRLASAWMRLAWGALYLGHDRRAHEFLRRASTVDDATTPRMASLAQGVALVLRWTAGDWDGLAQTARSYRRSMLDMPSASVAAGQVIGSLALAEGLDEAESWLTECVERGAAAGMARSVAVASAGLSRLWLRRGRPAAACQVAGRGVDEITAGGTWVWAAELVPTAVEAWLAADAPAAAENLYLAFAQGVSGRDAPSAEVALHHCRALLDDAAGDLERAADGYSAAQDMLVGMPRPHAAALMEGRRGRCLLGAGHPEGARTLAHAFDWLAALGASADAEEVAEFLRSHGGSVVAPNGAPGGGMLAGQPLTTREDEVADLAARGMTNDEIARVLHLSARTVEGHVAKAVRKLGLPSKRALIAARTQGGQAENA